jgi:serine/threonine-protein kinase
MRVPSGEKEPTTAAVRAQLARIIASPVFARAERLRRFLSYCVDSVVAGNPSILKEHTIGVAVYDRDATYDPRVDPIVRVEAARLRAKLREYYETSGSGDSLTIDIPKGTYVPRWQRRPQLPVAPSPRDAASIVVLPFANLTGDAADDYFSDGLTEELVHILGRSTGLRVVARTSAFRFKGATGDVRAIGARLGASMVLEGSVRRSRERVRIAARLIDAADGCEFWTEVYERRLADVIDLQQDLAASIAAALRVQIRAYHTSGRSMSPAAYDLYLRGRHLFNRRTVAAAERALEMLRQALLIEPDYRAARAVLANCHGLLAYWEVNKSYHLHRSVEEARRALEGAPEEAEAYIPLAHARIQDEWDWRGAEQDLLAAIAIDPNIPETHHLHAYFCLLPTGRFTQALESLEHALALDPLLPDLYATCGRALTLAGRPQEALARLQAGLELEPAYREIHWQIGLAHEASGDFAQALSSFDRAGELSPAGGAVAAGTIGHCLARAGRLDEARQLLTRDLDPAPTAMIRLGLGETDAALTALEAAAAARHRLMMWLKVDPRFRPLHGHPRFNALLSAVGLSTAPGTV